MLIDYEENFNWRFAVLSTRNGAHRNVSLLEESKASRGAKTQTSRFQVVASFLTDLSMLSKTVFKNQDKEESQ